MNTASTLLIRVTVLMHKTRKNVTLRWKQVMCITPHEGMVLRLTADDEKEKMDLVLIGVVYDYYNEMWLCDLEDGELVAELHNGDSADLNIRPEILAERVKYYSSFGFELEPPLQGVAR